MTTIILVIHSLLALVLIGVVLIQRSEGGGLGIGGGGGGGGLVSARGGANLLTRTTAILAAGFMATSLILAILAGGHSQPRSIVDDISTIPSSPTGTAPATPRAPVAQ
ncbi:MAG: preprotein translocase subunit SecG [Alphaproteobacteria bacterium]|nr:preprotein translocase subunit SecG [Alphaproteobacteria bacterium]MBU0797775.1 preprotein translocase subunit SecG [Alphaproteobacteria bacterium]MBU0887837.1 preprotein translocase subunit SecG [Alphaproteobacteria bacterium]MBU1814940.1 preprotein translocase subunit SecG [Alphaproteobacteria bacterium]MBU2089565.1 preprotein translocase subunit SecG [Alphaproteobacteria bacterium]